MTRKNNSKSAVATAKVKALESRLAKLSVKKSKSKATPFATSGQIVGKSVGSMFGRSGLGAGIGKWLGSGIGSIFGSGDYTQVGPSPAYNVLTNAKQIPQFTTNAQTNIVCHREYLGDINGTASFNNIAYPLNPGMPQTFPWLSSLAQNYQEYRIHGIVFEFKSLITDFVTSGAPGVVVMSTNYNADVGNYATKQQMENAEYAVSTKPTCDMIHGIECAPTQTITPQRYIRSGPVPVGQDLRLYDLGTFQFATMSNPVQDLGELWVSYCIEFYKPILPINVGGSVLSSHITRFTTVNGTNPLGLVNLTAVGTLGATATSTTISIPGAVPGQQYMVVVSYAGGTLTAFAAPSLTFTGLAIKQYWANDGATNGNAPTNTVSSSNFVVTFVVACTLSNPGTAIITFGTGGTLSGNSVDIFVTELDNAIIS
jgi:hypothetical protein